MSTLTGFLPSNTLAPGIQILEQDLSFVPAQPTFHSAGLVGFASKGPINIPTLISTTNQLTLTFGNPHPDVGDPYLIYAAQQYLLVGNQLWCVRVADTDPVDDEQATLASVEVPAAGGLIYVSSATPSPYSFDVDSFFSWALNGVNSSKTLVVLAGTYSAAELASDLNEQLAAADGIEFYATNDSEIGVQTTFAYGPSATLEFLSIQDAIYGGSFVAGNPTGLGLGMTPATTTGSVSQFPNTIYQPAGHYDFNSYVGLNIQIVLEGTGNALIEDVVQVIDLSSLESGTSTISEIVTAINNQLSGNGGSLPGGWIASATGNNLTFTTDAAGRGSRMLIKSSSTASSYFGLSNLTQTGTSPTGVTGDAGIENFGIIEGTTNSSGIDTFLLTADSVGIDGNATQVVITNSIQSGTFAMSVFNNGNQVENWSGLTKDSTSSFYVASFLASNSDYIQVVDNTATGAPPANGTYSLSGGSDGLPSDPDVQDTYLVGNPTTYTGLYALSDPTQIDIDLLAVPGHSSTTVVMALLSVCQNLRQDCLAIVDPPFGLTATEVVAWQNGQHPLNLTQFNSDFGALYWPWVMIRDTYNGVDVWVPPSGSVLATICRSDFLGAPWEAPAGSNRGIVPGIENVYNRPSQSELNQMYGNYNCVNPIITFPNLGNWVIWGQKTLQRSPTALDRVNVRRCLFYIEKEIRQATLSLVFEPNDAKLQQRFTTLATGILNVVLQGEGIYAFQILDDDTINTPTTIANNEFYAQIGIQPTYAAEFFYLTFSIFPPGSFTESSF